MNVPAGANAWQPVSFIRMPHHHASRLDLQNLEELRLLAEHRREVVRFTIEITSRDIYKVPDRYQWFATYTARVLELCTPAQQ